RRGSPASLLFPHTTLFRSVGDLAELFLGGAEDRVVLVDALDRHVGRDGDDVEPVNIGELLGFRRRRAGHAGELLVEAEVVLEGEDRKSTRLNSSHVKISYA